METETFHIDIASRENGGLQFIFENASKESWEPGVYDLPVFAAVDPNGFFVGFLNGRIIGCVSGVKFDEYYGFVGYYIVIPEYRGKGYGIQLFKHAMTYLGQRNIGLDGVPEQVANYRKSGFNASYEDSRYRGVGLGEIDISHLRDVVPSYTIDIGQLSSFDRRYFPAARESWIALWSNNSIADISSYACVDHGDVIGYGVIRRSISGYRLGPLYATNFDTAKKLLTVLRSKVSTSDAIFIDIPECNSYALMLMSDPDVSFTYLWGCTRMFTKEEPNVDNSGVYGLSSLELG